MNKALTSLSSPCLVAMIGMLLGLQHALAASCAIDAPGLGFGVYDPFLATPTDSVGSLTITCDHPTDYQISLSSGQGSYATRLLAGPGFALQYNLYTDATRSVVWGDGSGGSAIVEGTGNGGVHHVYGRIPALQNARVGAYADVITVLVSF